MVKGKPCVYKQGVCCQEVYCSHCQIFQEFLNRAQQHSEDIRKNWDTYQPIEKLSQN